MDYQVIWGQLGEIITLSWISDTLEQVFHFGQKVNKHRPRKGTVACYNQNEKMLILSVWYAKFKTALE